MRTSVTGTMLAWQVGHHGRPLEALQLTPRPVPSPGEGKLLVRVHSAAIGLPDARMCVDAYAFSPPLPFVPGQEVCGTVVATGEGTTTPSGARIMGVTDFFDGHGGLAEFCLVSEPSAFDVPESMDDDVAAGFRIGYSTAAVGFERQAALAPGESVLVLGAAGGTGAAAVELAKAMGAKVVAIVGGDEKAAFVRGLGADMVIDRTTTSVVDAVRAASDGLGVDIVFDPVGGSAATDAMRVMARGGRFLAVGFASGAWAVPDTAAMVRGDWSFLGVYAGATTREENERTHARLLELHATGRLDPLVRSIPFDRVAGAVQDVADGVTIGRTVVQIAPRGN